MLAEGHGFDASLAWLASCATQTSYYLVRTGAKREQMPDDQPLNENSPAVQAHLAMMQAVISRMAENSRSCKVWCVTLVAAVLVLVAQTGEPRHALIALVPTLLFLCLDAYYLALENAFRDSYDAFVNDLHAGKLGSTDIYKIKRTGMGLLLVGRSLGSVSIWLFYALLLATILLAWLMIL